MPFNEKQKRRFVAIAKAMKDKKGYVLKQKELQTDIANHKSAQKKLDDLKEEYSDCPAVIQRADEHKKKLQDIINELNEYMQILHPEGLLEMGTGSSGKSIMGQG